MNTIRQFAVAMSAVSILALSPLSVDAENDDIGKQLTEARLQGSVITAITLNRHLSPFSIEVDVDRGTATLSGTVESDVDRDLAEEVALGIDGIEQVDNQLQVDVEVERDDRSALRQRFEDATVTATIKSKLLWNRNTEGLDINVNTEEGVVTLAGEARSSEAKELAERLAENTTGVRKVNSDIKVIEGDPDKTRKTERKAADVVSDSWITSKVKSSFLFSRNLSGLDISVKTRDGQVKLDGSVSNSAEKDLAVETAQNIRGVKKVDASGLKVES